MKAMESLRDNGKGKINANVELFSLKFDTDTGKNGNTVSDTNYFHMYFSHLKKFLKNIFIHQE